MMKNEILNAIQIEQKINRMAFEIFEHNLSEKALVIAGIDGNGYKLAELLKNKLESISTIQCELGKISLNKKSPLDHPIAFNLDKNKLNNRTVILVDDVLNSGKTLMYAASEFLQVPLKKLSTVVLVDRNHNTYPVKADIVGLSMATTLQEHVNVDLSVKGKESAVLE
jgi:pyrimidine operon attenuation protein / uracil phosphoribosyltransferase